MVQKIAEDLIARARAQLAQDIYFVPKKDCYELFSEWEMSEFLFASMTWSRWLRLSGISNLRRV